MAIIQPAVAKKEAAGTTPTAPSIRFAADQLIRKTRKIMDDVYRAYVGVFSFIRILDTDSTPVTQIRIANVNGTLSIYGDPEATAQISLFIRKCLWISNGTVLFQANSGVISLGDVDNFDVFLRATRQGANDYLLEAEIDGGYIALENVTGSQAKVNTHAALTGNTHGIGPTGTFESEAGAQTKVNSHAVLTNAHGAAEVADAATVSDEIDSDISTHAALSTGVHGVGAGTVCTETFATSEATSQVAIHGAVTNTHGVSEIADAADLTTHEADTSTHGVTKVADDDGAGARVYRDSDQEIPNDTDTIITAYNQEQYDTDAIHSTVSNTSRLTCNTAGKYIITAGIQFEWDTFMTGLRKVELLLNGSTIIARIIDDVSFLPSFAISTLYSLAADDYVEVRVYQNSGVALDVDYIPAISPYFAMQRISG